MCQENWCIRASDEEMVGLYTVDCRRAIAAGLTFRPLAQTAADTLTWLKQREEEWAGRIGLDGVRETAILQAWRDSATER